MAYSRKKQEKLEQKIKDWEKEKQVIIAEQDLKEDIRQTKNRKKPPKAQRRKLTTTKFLMLFLFISCSVIEAFTMYAIIKSMNMGLGVDFTPLTMLITSVVAEVIGFSIYSLKSMKENTEGGIVYETALFEQKNNSFICEPPTDENDDEQEIMG